MSNLIGKDCWNIIAKYGLTEKDLLSLRATCKHMNNTIKSLNELWFKAYQWFLISTSNHTKAKSAVRVHDRELNVDCIKDNHPLLGDVVQNNANYAGRIRIVEKKSILIAKGDLTLDDCDNRYHWKYVVPQSRNDIPHDGYDKKNQYIYYYLIECYRYYNKKHEIEIRHIDKELDDLKPKVDRYHELSAKREELSQKYHENNVFKKCRVDNYKSI
jgi:hypothetical protein